MVRKLCEVSGEWMVEVESGFCTDSSVERKCGGVGGDDGGQNKFWKNFKYGNFGICSRHLRL